MRKLKEKNIRKLTRVSKSSMSVTIPVEILDELGWKEHQKVVVNLKGKKVVIEDWKDN